MLADVLILLKNVKLNTRPGYFVDFSPYIPYAVSGFLSLYQEWPFLFVLFSLSLFLITSGGV